jgi:HEPN domain-containing protein
MKNLTKDWILMADKDLSAAEILSKDDFPLANIVVFHCQQAIEKYLIAFFVENSIPIIKTHDLVKLNDVIKEIKDLGIDEKKLILVNDVYSESRYPGEIGLLPDGMLTNKQAKEFIEYAKEIKIVINKELKKDN